MAVSAVHTSSNAPTPSATPTPKRREDGSRSPEGSPRAPPPLSPFEGVSGADADVDGEVSKRRTTMETVPECSADAEGARPTAAAAAAGDGRRAGNPSGNEASEPNAAAAAVSSSAAAVGTPGRFDPTAFVSESNASGLQTPNDDDVSVAPATVYAAASELQRGRVTALDAVEGLNLDANEVLNDRAVSVMRRMSHKLTGRDGAPGSASAGAPNGSNRGGALSPEASHGMEDVENSTPDTVEAQVQRLVVAATSHENLCQSYIGWCPFW